MSLFLSLLTHKYRSVNVAHQWVKHQLVQAQFHRYRVQRLLLFVFSNQFVVVVVFHLVRFSFLLLLLLLLVVVVEKHTHEEADERLDLKHVKEFVPVVIDGRDYMKSIR